MLDSIKFIPKDMALNLIFECHYSKVMPRITKYYIGGFIKDELVAVMTLGWGVRPVHTIKKIFPTLDVNDYFELGKLCVKDKCPKNTESYFISQCIKLIQKELPKLKILFSWADGIIGKPGYVYQCSNFYYGGFIWTEMYLDANGNRVHPRSMQGISTGDKAEGTKFKSRAYDITKNMGYTKYFGLQFRYVYPLCNKKEWKTILQSSPYTWTRNNYPKDINCLWKIQKAKGIIEKCAMPPFVITEYVKKVDKVDRSMVNLFFNERKEN